MELAPSGGASFHWLSMHRIQIVWGNELILRDGKPVGSITSAAFGHTIGKPVALGLLIIAATVRPIGPGLKAAIIRSTWPAYGMRLPFL